MINRQNYHDVKKYLHYLQDVRRNKRATLKRRRSQLRHLLEWADEAPLSEAHELQPTFPSYLESARNDGRDVPLAPSTRKATCGTVQRFFHWARLRHPRRYREVSPAWIDNDPRPEISAAHEGSRSFHASGRT